MQRLNTLAGMTPSPRAEVVAFTLSDLKAFAPERLHAGKKVRSLDWALEGNALDDAGPKTKARAAKVKLASEQMLVPVPTGKGAKVSGKEQGKGCKGNSKEVIAALKKKSWQLGISFDEKRAKDIAALLAAVKATVEGVDE